MLSFPYFQDGHLPKPKEKEPHEKQNLVLINGRNFCNINLCRAKSVARPEKWSVKEDWKKWDIILSSMNQE